jgi:hypothetical protein
MRSPLNTHSALLSDCQRNPAPETPLPGGQDTPLWLIQSSLAPNILPARRPVIPGPH